MRDYQKIAQEAKNRGLKIIKKERARKKAALLTVTFTFCLAAVLALTVPMIARNVNTGDADNEALPANKGEFSLNSEIISDINNAGNNFPLNVPGFEDSSPKAESPHVGKSSASLEENTDMQPMPPLLQMDSIDEIVDVLKNFDNKACEEEFKKYNTLFSTLKNLGFIYNVATAYDTSAEDAITFWTKDGKKIFYVQPYVERYEDPGIASYTVFREELYRVYVYTADKKVLSQAKTVSEYLKNRLNREVLNEVTVEENIICFMTDGNEAARPTNCAASFIDDNYYYVVSTEASQDDLHAFLANLSFEKISFE